MGPASNSRMHGEVSARRVLGQKMKQRIFLFVLVTTVTLVGSATIKFRHNGHKGSVAVEAFDIRLDDGESIVVPVLVPGRLWSVLDPLLFICPSGCGSSNAVNHSLDMSATEVRTVVWIDAGGPPSYLNEPQWENWASFTNHLSDYVCLASYRTDFPRRSYLRFDFRKVPNEAIRAKCVFRFLVSSEDAFSDCSDRFPWGNEPPFVDGFTSGKEEK